MSLDSLTSASERNASLHNWCNVTEFPMVSRDFGNTWGEVVAGLDLGEEVSTNPATRILGYNLGKSAVATFGLKDSVGRAIDIISQLDDTIPFPIRDISVHRSRGLSIVGLIPHDDVIEALDAERKAAFEAFGSTRQPSTFNIVPVYKGDDGDEAVVIADKLNALITTNPKNPLLTLGTPSLKITQPDPEQE